MPFFADSEFDNRKMMKQSFIDKLEAFRADLGYPTTLTADYATTGHAKLSLHGQGKAIDGTNEAPLWDFMTKAIKAGFTGIGLYLRNGKLQYFHLDDRESAPQMWVCEADKNNYIYKIGG
jgi:hypothetical protein